MNSNNKFNEDQASDLKQMFDEINKNGNKVIEEKEEVERDPDQIDILNLPPRKEVHSKNTTFKITINRSLLRIVFVALILTLFLVFYLWEEEVIELLKHLGILKNS